MSKLFQILPEDFFKPFTSKYKQIYVDCILLIFCAFKPEISYGVNREVVINTSGRCLQQRLMQDIRSILLSEQPVLMKRVLKISTASGEIPLWSLRFKIKRDLTT